MSAETLQYVHSWGYQLDKIDPDVIAASPYDLMVIDHSDDGTTDGIFSAKQVEYMKHMPSGKDRLLIAYMSIGEAEDYRFYWDLKWNQATPSWIEKENQNWPGNYKVYYWNEEWQKIIFGGSNAYLDRIIAAGFDGVYLDIIDAFEYFQGTFPEAPNQMSQFIVALNHYAKQQNPNFIIIAQNGESLLKDSKFLNAIDGIAKEDLYYGMVEEGVASPADETQYSLGFLKKAKDAGKLVLNVTYIEDPTLIDEVFSKSKKLGFIPYAGIRELDSLKGAASLTEVNLSQELKSISGSFLRTTIPKGQWKAQFSLGYYQEKDFYREYDDLGMPTYYEEAKYSEYIGFIQLKYGVTDYLSLGINLPMKKAKNEITSYEESTSESLTQSSSGLGNVGLLADLGRSWNDGASSALLEIEFGLPTSDKEDIFSGGSNLYLSLNLGHYWDDIGVISTFSNESVAQKDFDKWDSVFSYQLGFGVDFQPTISSSFLIGESDKILNSEISIEWLFNVKSLFELTLGSDLEGDRDAFYGEVSIHYWFDSQ